MLRLLGTALAQEHAGAAFRATSAGLTTAGGARFDRRLLDGITAAASGPVTTPARAAPADLDVDALLRSSFTALEQCCADSGAIAAAPAATRMRELSPAWFGLRSPLDAAVAGSALLGYRPDLDRLDDPWLVDDGLGSTGGGAWPVTTLWLAQWHRLRGDHERGSAHLRWVLSHVEAASMTEQVDVATGEPRGARGLAWSQAELLTALLLL